MFRKLSFIAITLLGMCLFTGRAVRAESLNEAWTFALANSPRLAAAEYQSVASEHDLKSTRSERLPDVSLGSSYIVRNDSPSFRVQSAPPGFNRFSIAQREAAAADFEVRVPVYTSGRIKNSILSAQSALSATQYDFATTRSDLYLAIGEAYLAVQSAQRELEVAEQDHASLAAHEVEVKSLFDQQRVPQNDLLAAQVTSATASQNCLRAVKQLQTARATYNRLLGRSLYTHFQLQELHLLWLPQSLEQMTQMAWQQRSELRHLQAAADGRHFEAQRLLAARRPQVSAIGRYEFEENRYRSPQAITSAALVVDWNLLDGGKKKWAANAEISRAASLGRLLEDFKSQVSLDLLSAWNDRHEAAARRNVATQTIGHADENLRVSRLRYARGMAVQSEVLDAQSRRTQVARDFFTAAHDVALAQLRLRHAAGILEMEIRLPNPK